ncbi:MAG: signal peptidase [Planctomycetes bacterium]|nr:signal peptidase [Planctomycetota bacterium]
MSQVDSTRNKSSKHNKKSVLIRYGKMGLLGWFTHSGIELDQTRTRVVIKTRRGLEMGNIVGPHCYKGGSFRCSKEKVDEYYSNRSKDYPFAGDGTFVRYATSDDINEAEHLEISARKELEYCQNTAKEMNLEMKIVEAEHLLGGERIVFYFTSETRVDFRDLVKHLAHEYQTRIELRQIGARDEARLISDYESCGQQCCCQRFLKILAPVNMRMAKIQKATLDPSKISGHCGRLKCCLRYEDSTYRELRKGLPNKNTPVRTANGEGRVINTHVLTQLVEVMCKGGRREAFPVGEIEVISEEEFVKATTVAESDRGRGRRPEGARQYSRPETGDRGKRTEGGDGGQDSQQEKEGKGRNRRGRRGKGGNGGGGENKAEGQSDKSQASGEGQSAVSGESREGGNKEDAGGESAGGENS